MSQSIISKYFENLGGIPRDFDPNTVTRVMGFFNELNLKRTYDKFTVFESDTDEMIIGNHLKLFSFCEHHLLPFYGEVAIGYIPSGKIMGLSKFQRIVDRFSSRPQIQERLTSQVCKFIEDLLNPLGVGVVVRAIHTCVFARGTQSSQAEFTTNAMIGRFREQQSTRHEFLSVVMSNGRNQL